MKTEGPRTWNYTQRRQAVTEKGSRGGLAERTQTGGLDRAHEVTESRSAAYSLLWHVTLEQDLAKTGTQCAE